MFTFDITPTLYCQYDKVLLNEKKINWKANWNKQPIFIYPSLSEKLEKYQFLIQTFNSRK